MNLHAVYFSPTKTTKKIVESIAKGIGFDHKNYDITMPEQREIALEFDEKDCLVIGVPVYSGRIPEITENFLLRMKGHITPVIIVAVYGNRDYEDAIIEMKDMLEKQGFVPIAAGAFIGEHSFTHNVASKRPDFKDLLISESFGNDVRDLLENKSLDDHTLEVKGNRPYRKRNSPPPVGPTVSSSCVKCGTCVSSCPANALKLDDIIQVNPNSCLRCHACTRNCPTGAIEFDNRIAHIKKWLEDSFTVRQEPELFI